MVKVDILHPRIIDCDVLAHFKEIEKALPAIISQEISNKTGSSWLVKPSEIITETRCVNSCGKYQFVIWIDASANKDRLSNAKEHVNAIYSSVKKLLPKNCIFAIQLQLSRSAFIDSSNT